MKGKSRRSVPSQVQRLTLTKRHLIPKALKVHKYHGQLKQIDNARIKELDVMLTTYATVEADIRRGSEKEGRNLFAGVRWFRVILDEGTT